MSAAARRRAGTRTRPRPGRAPRTAALPRDPRPRALPRPRLRPRSPAPARAPLTGSSQLGLRLRLGLLDLLGDRVLLEQVLGLLPAGLRGNGLDAAGDGRLGGRDGAAGERGDELLPAHQPVARDADCAASACRSARGLPSTSSSAQRRGRLGPRRLGATPTPAASKPAHEAIRRTLAVDSQSDLKRSRPCSVSGWESIWRNTLAGTVATSQPSRAAVTTCSGWRIEAASTSVVVPPGRSVSTISANHGGGVDRDVVEPAHEAGRERRAGLRREQRLVGREDEGHVDPDAVVRERPGRGQPLAARRAPSRPRARAASRARGPPRSCPRRRRTRPRRSRGRRRGRRCGARSHRARPSPWRAATGSWWRRRGCPRRRSPRPLRPIRCL